MSSQAKDLDSFETKFIGIYEEITYPDLLNPATQEKYFATTKQLSQYKAYGTNEIYQLLLNFKQLFGISLIQRQLEKLQKDDLEARQDDCPHKIKPSYYLYYLNTRRVNTAVRAQRLQDQGQIGQSLAQMVSLLNCIREATTKAKQ